MDLPATAIWPFWQVYPFFRSWEVLRDSQASSGQNSHAPQKSIAIQPKDCRKNAVDTADSREAFIKVDVVSTSDLRSNRLTASEFEFPKATAKCNWLSRPV